MCGRLSRLRIAPVGAIRRPGVIRCPGAVRCCTGAFLVGADVGCAVDLGAAPHAASPRKTPPGLEGSKGMRALAGAWEVLFISFAYPFPSAFGAALGCEKLWERSAETGLSAIGSNEDANYERKRKSYPPQDSFRGNSNWFLRSHLTDESYPRKLPNCFVAIETRYINEIE